MKGCKGTCVCTGEVLGVWVSVWKCLSAVLCVPALPWQCLMAIGAHRDVLEPHECSRCLEAAVSWAICMSSLPCTTCLGLEGKH